MFVDLHCHSLFSVDGWVTPEELAEKEAERGVGVLALTDHNSVDGLERCRVRAEQLGMRFINGCEFDAMRDGVEYHFVAIGFDPGNVLLRDLCKRQFSRYALNFDRIMPVLERRYGICREDLEKRLSVRYRTHPAPVMNKWFARGALMELVGLPDMKTASGKVSEAVREAERDVQDPWGWASMAEVRDAVHNAGGIILLAHPAGYARGNFEAQKALIETMLEGGLDGFELYHPSAMMEEHFDKLVDLARGLRCAVSGGSDSHFAGGKAPAGLGGSSAPDWVLDTIDPLLRSK